MKQSEEASEIKEKAIVVFHIQVWVHVASRRRYKTYVIEQTLKELVDFELESTEFEVHWLEEQTQKSHCSRIHQHSDTYVTFEGACTSEVSDQLITELRSITGSLMVTSPLVKAFDITTTTP